MAPIDDTRLPPPRIRWPLLGIPVLTSVVVFCGLLPNALGQDTAAKARPPLDEDEEVVHFDLLANLHRAHIRQNGLILSFSTPGYRKYTVGDWHQAWRPTHDADGRATLLTGRGEARFFATDDDVGRGSIGLRAKGGRADVFLNHVFVGEVTFPADRFSYETPRMTADITRGENSIELIAKAREGGAPHLLIDYLRVGFENTDLDDATTSTDLPLGIAPQDTDGLSLPAEASLSYHLFIPPAAALLIETIATEPCSQLEISVETDSGRNTFDIISSADAGDTFYLPLHEFHGEAAEVSLKALDGDVRFTKARLVRRIPKADRTEPAPSIQNVLIVMVDTLRRDRLKTFNLASNVRTDAIEKLGRESAVFENAFAQSNWTKPSIGTLFTGVYPLSHGASTHTAVLNRDITTLPEHLKAAGFRTAGFVANGYISDKFGFGRGWDDYKAYGTVENPGRGPQLVRDAVQWIKQQPSTQRFFAYVHTIDVHAPYRSPRYIWSRYDADRYHGIVRAKETASLLNLIRAGSLILRQRDILRLTALYDGAVSYHDQTVGYLIDALKKAGILENTLVVFTSDHGEELFDHGSVGHGHTLYNELVRIPLMMRLPQSFNRQKRHVDLPVGLVDLLPTLCDLLKIETPARRQGRSFARLFSDSSLFGDERVQISESQSGREIALRFGQLNAIFHDFYVKLFNTTTDPKEMTDQKAGFPIARRTMIDLLGDHLAMQDAWPNQQAAKETSSSVHPAEIDAETKRRLEALGYMGD